MRSSRVCAIVALIIVSAVPTLSQTSSYSCVPPREVLEARLTAQPVVDLRVPFRRSLAERIRAITVLLKRYPDDAFLHTRYQASIRTDQKYGLTGITWDQLIERYRRSAEREPTSPVYAYLYARALMGTRTREAIQQFEGILHRWPDFPWSHLALFEIYQYPAFFDPEKMRTHLDEFLESCPNSLEAYVHLQTTNDAEFLNKPLTRFRKALDGSSDIEALREFPNLWRLEFQAAAGKEQVRRQLRQDLERLRQMNLRNDLVWLSTLREGYSTLGDSENARLAEDWILERFPYSETANAIRRYQFNTALPPPKPDALPEDRTKFNRAYAKAVEQWMEVTPDDPSLHLARFTTLAAIEETPAAELESAADRFLTTYGNGGMTVNPPAGILVAQILLQRKVALDRIPMLVEEGITEFERRIATDYTFDFSSINPATNITANNSLYWTALELMFDALIETGQLTKAREVIFRMKDLLNTMKPSEKADDDAKRTYLGYELRYWDALSNLAEKENRDLDALSFYQKALLLGLDQYPMFSDRLTKLTRRAVNLWSKLGGSLEGWRIWTDKRISMAVQHLAPEKWNPQNVPLPNFELPDLEGRKWHLSDLKGKVTLVSIWASWCGPCRFELPVVQRLYERLQGRDDVQVITLNVDDDVDVVEPYVKKERLTLPAIPAFDYVQNLMKYFAIPRTWIVDRDGVIRLEHTGFKPEDGNQWIEQTIGILERAKSGRF